MTDAMAAIVQMLISGIWAYFSITVPGFTFTYGQALIGFIIINLGFVLLGLFGFRRSGSGYRSGSTSKPKISKERKDDEI